MIRASSNGEPSSAAGEASLYRTDDAVIVGTPLHAVASGPPKSGRDQPPFLD